MTRQRADSWRSEPGDPGRDVTTLTQIVEQGLECPTHRLGTGRNRGRRGMRDRAPRQDPIGEGMTDREMEVLQEVRDGAPFAYRLMGRRLVIALRDNTDILVLDCKVRRAASHVVREIPEDYDG